MRVAVVGIPTKPNWPGGEPILVQALVDELRRTGVECTLLGGFEDLAADPPARAAERVATGFFSYRSLVREFSRDRPDVVLGFTDADTSYLQAARSLAIPVVATAHIYWMLCPKWDLFDWRGRVCPGPGAVKCLACTVHSLKVPWMANSLGFARHVAVAREVPKFVICPSRYVAETLASAGHDLAKLVVVPNGIDLERFPFREVEATRRVIFLGQHSARKGYPAFVRIARELDDQGLEFVSVGGPAGWNGDHGAVRQLGRVPVSEIPALLATAQVVVVPSLWAEPFGLVTLEAMSTGRPVVAFDSGALSEQILDGVTGVLIEPGNVDAMGKAILELTRDLERCREMGRHARERSRAMDVRRIAEQYHRLLERALEGPGRRTDSTDR